MRNFIPKAYKRVAEKRCRECGVTKPSKEFTANKKSIDGLRSECKQCKKVQARKWRVGNLDNVNQANRKSYQRNKEKVLEYRKIERQTPEGRARKAVYSAVRAGKLKPVTENKCAWPGGCNEKARNYHHESYDEKDWLKVIPLCTKHHAQIHWKPGDG